MRRRSRAGGEPRKPHRRKTAARKSRITRHRSSSRASKETTVARLTRERDEALQQQRRAADDNKRLLNELRESLQQQTATSEVLQVISSSPGDLEPVFAAMLEKAVRICDATFGNIYRRDGDKLRLVAAHNTPPAFVEYRTPSALSPHPSNPVGRMLRTKTTVHVTDVVAEQAYVERDPAMLAAVERGGIRTGLCVPLLNESEVIGAFTLFRGEVRAFTDKQIELVKNFAAQAVIAIENARLLNVLRESLQQQTATADVLKVISRSAFNLQRVLDTLVESAARLCEADMASINRERDDGAYQQIANYGHSPELIAYMRSHPIPPGRASVAGRVVKDGRIVHLPDVLAEPDYQMTKAAEIGGIRTMLGVPLLREGRPIGVITLQRREVRPFTETQIKLVETFADQAVIAIENVRLFEAEQQRTRELAESLEQQTATSDVLQVISKSPGALEPVFSTILENATRICDATFGNVYTWNGDAFHLVAAHNTPPAFAESRKRGPFRPSHTHPFSRLVEAKEIFHIDDVAALPGYTERDPQIVEPVELGGIRTCLGVPMVKDNELIGALVIFRQEVRPFADKQIALVANFAAQAVIAIENTRLLNELRESLQQQTSTADVLKVISRSAFDLATVLNTLVQSAARLCDADTAILMLPRDGTLHWDASYGFSPEYAEFVASNPAGIDRGTVSGRVLLESRIVHVSDVLADPEYTYRVGGYRTILGVPLLREGAPIGVIALGRNSVRPFTDKQIELATTFADQAVIAIENTRLFEAEQQRTRELAESLEQQTATSEVLQVISSSPGDLQPVFENMLANAARICDAHIGGVYRWDGQFAQLAAATPGLPPAYAATVRYSPFRPDPKSLIGRSVLRTSAVQFTDFATDELYINQRDPFVVANVELGGLRTGLFVPMLKENEPIGFFTLAREDVRPFTEKQIALITSFAAQAVIAIENARLLNELRESLAQQTATADVLKVISRSAFDLQSVLNTLVESAARLCEADMVGIAQSHGDTFQQRAFYGFSPEYRAFMQQHPIPVGRGSITGRVLQDRCIFRSPTYWQIPNIRRN